MWSLRAFVACDRKHQFRYFFCFNLHRRHLFSNWCGQPRRTIGVARSACGRRPQCMGMEAGRTLANLRRQCKIFSPRRPHRQYPRTARNFLVMNYTTRLRFNWSANAEKQRRSPPGGVCCAPVAANVRRLYRSPPHNHGVTYLAGTYG